VKDLEQAGALLARLRDTRAADIERAWRDLLSRGPEWRRRAKRGLDALQRPFPDLPPVAI
jgi:hypothetical protein